MPNGSIDPKLDYVADLSAAKGIEWPTITTAHTKANEVLKSLSEMLRTFTSDDVDIVVFGSLARKEWTSGSDVDWTMLVDGQANPAHLTTSREISKALKEAKLPAPGSQGIFGNMAFSHEIVHHIGGQADTNRNTTQRILLLLEAVAISNCNNEPLAPYDRIVRQVLNRYLRSDSNFHKQADKESRIPRFLLNDIVRYWRTMCVDFAYKDWEQAGQKWAIRNIKLRTSRKLLFLAGLFTVFSCFKNDSLSRDQSSSDNYLNRLQKHLLEYVHSTPLNIVVWTLQKLGMEDCCTAFLDSYEQFLCQIDDEKVREHLGNLKEDQVYSDKIFLDCRKISHDLQDTLKTMCFETKSPLREFINEYGVF